MNANQRKLIDFVSAKRHQGKKAFVYGSTSINLAEKMARKYINY